MYSNNILNFQVSTTIFNACTKKYGNLLKASRTSIKKKFPSISSRGALINVVNGYILMSEFELQLHCFVHVRTNTLRKGANFVFPPALALIVRVLNFLKDGFDFKQPTKFVKTLNGECKSNQNL